MGIDEGGHIVLTGNVLYQFINDERRLGVQAGIGFIAEQILRVQGNGACDGNSFLHTATDFTGEFIFRFNKVYALQAKHGTARAVAQGIRAEHVEGEHNVVQYRHRVEQGGALEYHPHFAAQGFLFFLSHGKEIAVVV